MAANSTVTLTITGQAFNSSRFNVRGTLAVGAGGYPVNGIPVVFSAVPGVTNLTPLANTVRLSGLAGFIYAFDDVHQTLRIFEAGASGTPLGEIITTTPASVVADTISVEVDFSRAS